MRRRISAEFSPIPAVNTSPSNPPKTAAECSDLFGCAVHEIVDRELRARLAAGQEVAHVVADAGNTQ